MLSSAGCVFACLQAKLCIGRFLIRLPPAGNPVILVLYRAVCPNSVSQMLQVLGDGGGGFKKWPLKVRWSADLLKVPTRSTHDQFQQSAISQLDYRTTAEHAQRAYISALAHRKQRRCIDATGMTINFKAYTDLTTYSRQQLC